MKYGYENEYTMFLNHGELLCSMANTSIQVGNLMQPSISCPFFCFCRETGAICRVFLLESDNSWAPAPETHQKGTVPAFRLGNQGNNDNFDNKMFTNVSKHVISSEASKQVQLNVRKL